MGDEPSVHVPLPEYVREAAREAAWTVIKEHVTQCPIAGLEKRVTTLEKRFYLVVGAIIGSGALGGATAAGIIQMFGG